MTARFRPESNSAPRVLRWTSDPPRGVRASVYYAHLILTVPRTVGVLVSTNMYRLVRQDLGTSEAAAEWLADLVKRRGAPIMLNIGNRTIAVGPSTTEQLFGHIAVMHEVLESEFGPIERVYRPESAA
jgi:hypothetical protein